MDVVKQPEPVPISLSDSSNSDPEMEIIEKDSGLSSLTGSKDETPERKIEIEPAPPSPSPPPPQPVQEELKPSSCSTVQNVNYQQNYEI